MLKSCWVGGGGLQRFSVSPRPLGFWFFSFWVWGLRVWGQGLTIFIESAAFNISDVDSLHARGA